MISKNGAPKKRGAPRKFPDYLLNLGKGGGTKGKTDRQAHNATCTFLALWVLSGRSLSQLVKLVKDERSAMKSVSKLQMA